MKYTEELVSFLQKCGNCPMFAFFFVILCSFHELLCGIEEINEFLLINKVIKSKFKLETIFINQLANNQNSREEILKLATKRKQNNKVYLSYLFLFDPMESKPFKMLRRASEGKLKKVTNKGKVVIYFLLQFIFSQFFLLINMKSALDLKNNRSSKQKLKYTKVKDISQWTQLQCNCFHLKSQIKELKQLQIELSNRIKLTLQSLQRQAQVIIFSVLTKVKEEIQRTYGFSEPKNSNFRSLPSQDKLQSQNKQNEGSNFCTKLKKTIFEEFKLLKVLESRSNHLRETNLQLNTMRKSLSKQSLVNRAQSSKHHVRKTKQNLNFDTFNQKVYTQQARQMSPEFGEEDRNFKKVPSNTFSQQLFSQNEKFMKEKSEFKLLKCPNGHVYYRGTTQKNIPHGRGTLINCCSKIPIKIKSKVVQYEGDFVNGVFEGNGVLKCKGNVRFQGCFKNGLRNGNGVIYLSQMGQAGIWQSDQLKSKV